MEMMNAFVLHGRNDLRLEQRPVPDVASDSVLIRVVRAGICGSDMHYYGEGRVGDFVPQMPFVLGHEISGEIVECGKTVSTVAKGDRVIVEPAIPCGSCSACRRGRYNLCGHMRVLGSASAMPHADGGFADFVVVPSRSCFLLPGELSYQEGALVEPLAVAVHALARAGSVTGRSVLITGAGTIGEMTLTMCRAAGAARIAVTDVDEFARGFALSHGADAVFDPAGEGFPAKAGRFASDGFDVVFEASGAPAALRQGLELATRGATIVQVGMLPPSVTLNLGLVASKELQVTGSFRYANAFEVGLELLMNRRVQINGVVTHVFKFEDTQKALACAMGGDKALKVHVEHSGVGLATPGRS